MKFYKLTYSINKKEIGILPQISDGFTNCNDANKKRELIHKGINSQTDLKDCLPNLIFNKKVIVTDILTSSDNVYLYINEKLLSIFLDFKCDQYKYWKIKVYNHYLKFDSKKLDYVVTDSEKLKIFDYYLFHISYPKIDFIDYNNTFFYSYIETGKDIRYDKVRYITSKQRKFYDDIYYRTKDMPTMKERIIIEDQLKFSDYDDFINQTKIIKEKDSSIKFEVKKLTFNTRNIKNDLFRIKDTFLETMGYYVSENLKEEIEKNKITGVKFIPLSEINDSFEIDITD